MKRILALLLALVMLFSLTACGLDQETLDLALDVAETLLTETEESPTEEAPAELPTETPAEQPEELPEPEPEEVPEEVPEEAPEEIIEDTPEEAPAIDEDGVYDSKDDVALYIHTYGHLPKNFMTKKEARKLGWEGGGLDDYADGMCIGGDYFGNYEGLLPEADGREYTECDIDTLHASKRGAKRIIFSNDGLIYYTDDHYESFTLLYGDENQ